MDSGVELKAGALNKMTRDVLFKWGVCTWVRIPVKYSSIYFSA